MVTFVFFFVSQRRDIVTGTVEPTDEECEWHSDRDEEEELAVSTLLGLKVFQILNKCNVNSTDNINLKCHLQEEVKEKAAIEDAKKEEATPQEDPKGIPEFWLIIFKSVDMLSDMLQVLYKD